MMNAMHPDDAAELHGDGYRNEFQRAAAWSSIEQNANRPTDNLDNLLAQGLFVGVSYRPRYCRYTDALLGGEDRSVLFACATREEAVARFVALGDPDDARWVVLPTIAEESAQEPPDDGVPF